MKSCRSPKSHSLRARMKQAANKAVKQSMCMTNASIIILNQRNFALLHIILAVVVLAGCRRDWRVPQPYTAAAEKAGWLPRALLHCPVPDSCPCMLLLLLSRQPPTPGPICHALHSLSFPVSIAIWRLVAVTVLRDIVQSLFSLSCCHPCALINMSLFFRVYILKRILTWYYSRKISKNEEKLKSLLERKEKILDEVMETETYKVAKEILEKYAPDQLRKNQVSWGVCLQCQSKATFFPCS